MLLERARELIKEVKIGYLATVEGDQPRVRAMSAHLTDEGRILMATGKETDKMRQVAANPKAEFCFVSERWDQLRAEGRLRVIEEQAEKDRFWGMEPALKDYFRSSADPNYALLEFVPVEIEIYEAKTGEFHHRHERLD
jgi:general stress protein 26